MPGARLEGGEAAASQGLVQRLVVTAEVDENEGEIAIDFVLAGRMDGGRIDSTGKPDAVGFLIDPLVHSNGTTVNGDGFFVVAHSLGVISALAAGAGFLGVIESELRKQGVIPPLDMAVDVGTGEDSEALFRLGDGGVQTVLGRVGIADRFRQIFM